MKISEMTDVLSLSGPELFELVQGGATKRCSANQLLSFVGAGLSGSDLALGDLSLTKLTFDANTPHIVSIDADGGSFDALLWDDVWSLFELRANNSDASPVFRRDPFAAWVDSVEFPYNANFLDSIKVANNAEIHGVADFYNEVICHGEVRGSFVLKAPNDSEWYIKVSNAGVLSAVAV